VDFYCKHPDAPRYICHFNLNTIKFKPATITSSCSNLEGEMDVRETLLNAHSYHQTWITNIVRVEDSELGFFLFFSLIFIYLDLVNGQ